MRKISAVVLLLSLAFAGFAPFGGAQKVPDPPFIERGRGYKPLTPERSRVLHATAAARHGDRLAMMGKFQTLPAAYDCRDKGWVPPVGDQGQCGSCYLYSTIYGTLTSAFIRAGFGKADGSFIMAVQYGMDCHNFGGCNGGNGTEVIDWVMRNGWPAESWVDVNGTVFHDYPGYSARSLSCRKVTTAKYWKPADWGFATGDQSDRPATTAEIKTALINYGPLNVALDAGGQFGNGTSTITALGTSIDHEIELVAWDDAKDGGAFLLKNQWSKSWGNAGYRWLTYNAASRLVDIFWVSAATAPPPPPPPTGLTVTVANVSGMIGVPVKFSPIASGGTAPYIFVFDYGEPPQDASGSHAYVNAGSYKVTVTAVDAKGQLGTGTCTATIGTTPPPPGPGPVAAGTITWTINGVTSQYELMPIGTRDALKKVTDILGPMAP